MRRFLVFALLLAAPIPEAEAKDIELAKGYALAFATATFASGHCAGMDVNENGLLVLKNVAGLSDGDDAWLAREINHAKPAIEKAFYNEGAEVWCNKAWTLFGPESIGILQK